MAFSIPHDSQVDTLQEGSDFFGKEPTWQSAVSGVKCDDSVRLSHFLGEDTRATSGVITCTCHSAILSNLFPHHPYRMVRNRGEREAGVHALVGCSVLSILIVNGLSPCVNSISPESHPSPLIKIYSVHTCLMGTSTNPALYGVLDSQWRPGVPMSVALGTKRDSKSAGDRQGVRPGGL